jgi:hypothetical protein
LPRHKCVPRNPPKAHQVSSHSQPPSFCATRRISVVVFLSLRSLGRETRFVSQDVKAPSLCKSRQASPSKRDQMAIADLANQDDPNANRLPPGY